MLSRLLALSALTALLFSCHTEDKKAHSISRYDSLTKDMVTATLLSYQDAETTMPNYLIEGDTLLVKQSLFAIPDTAKLSVEKVDISLDSGSQIIVIRYNKVYVRLKVLGKNPTYCFLPFNDVLRIANENIDDSKILFYDYQKYSLIKYERLICKKYGLTFEELDSMSFMVVDELAELRKKLKEK